MNRQFLRTLRVLTPLLLCTLTTYAQDYAQRIYAQPHVLLIKSTGSQVQDSLLGEEVISAYYNTLEQGFRADGMPRFMLSGRDQKMIFGVGGNLVLRGSYDFGGEVQSLDFITSNIPVPNAANTQQGLGMNATSSNIFFKTVAHAGCLGTIVGYVSFDFRGYQNQGVTLQQAYVSVGGFSVGQRVSTFCDLQASPSTVDYQGPNSYPYVYTAQIRYTHSFDEHFTAAVALEMPQSTITTTNSDLSLITPRMPDIPLYLQYQWGKERGATLTGHVRATAMFRSLVYYNEAMDRSQSSFGWGTQLSASVPITRALRLYGQGIYGAGIATYMQDINGLGLDLVPSAVSDQRLVAPHMAGWIAGAQYLFNTKWSATAVYSAVKVVDKEFEVDNTTLSSLYDSANYLSANVFYNIRPSLQAGLSYLYGTRKNWDCEQGHANRVQAMIAFSF